MSRLPHHTLRLVGVALVIFAGLGLWYNGTTMFTDFPADPSTPYFRHAFYAMSAICVACYFTLLFVGLQFIRLKSSLVRLFIGVVIFEVVYTFGVGLFWTGSGLGLSIAAATGVANGGLMLQFLTLFPIWGPLLARWAKRCIEAPPEGSTEILFPDEQIARPSDWIWAAVNFVVIFILTSVLIRLAWHRLYPGTLSPAYLTMGIPLLLSTANALASVRLRRKRRRSQIQRRQAARLHAGLCPRCEYNLTGLPEPRCPECGTEFEVPSRVPNQGLCQKPSDEQAM